MKTWCYEHAFSNDLQLQSRQSQFVGRKHVAYDACEARDARYSFKDYLSETIWNLNLVSQALL